jgi:hypothetical protein
MGTRFVTDEPSRRAALPASGTAENPRLTRPRSTSLAFGSPFAASVMTAKERRSTNRQAGKGDRTAVAMRPKEQG